MQVSSKVSYSIIVYLERQGIPLEPFFETVEMPLELFKDPSCWISAPKMEYFLASLFSYLQFKDPEHALREIGQKSHELRAWGVLDSVLKMVESPRDIFMQPERFLSYFLTPHPALEIVNSGENFVEVRLKRAPAAPLINAYLLGAVEGLPTYTGKPLARIEPQDEKSFTLTWFDDQQSLFDEQESKRRQFHPKIVHSVLQSLKEQQMDGQNSVVSADQNATHEAFEKMVHVEVEKRMAEYLSRFEEVDETMLRIRHDFFKMYDYFTRAQQIITLVTPTARKASVKEAMRRVDWEYVQKEFPRLVEGACDAILTIKDQLHRDPVELTPQPRQMTNLNELIDSVVETLSLGERTLTVEREWNLDRDVPVDSEKFSSALSHILSKAVGQMDKEGELKMSTKPIGSKVQIEITDNGKGFESTVLENFFNEETDKDMAESMKIIQSHQGHFSVSSRKGAGATYLIELPLA